MIKFGTDGWRGVIGDDFTFDNVKVVSQAIADYLKKGGKKRTRVVVGYDRRFLSQEFAAQVSSVLAANKIRVVLSSKSIPTPTVSFHALYGKYDLGVMITASHNPAKFNGLKIKTKDGGAADKSLTDKIERLLGKSKIKDMSLQEAISRKFVKIEDLDSEYVRFLKDLFDIKKIRKLKLKILMDNMHGAGNGFVERVIQSSSIRIDYLNNEFNPSFGGRHPEPIEENLSTLIRRVKKEKYDLGIALDGDADRIAAVTSGGEFINAQVILPLLAIHMAKNRGECRGIGKTIVGSNLIDEVALSLGAPCYETPVGFKYISNLFKENLISIGGEEAGG
ncbi:phosphoglucomutase/phosphomannomutase family protein, partial [candidate division WOR-3 bacterium]|nr:phosphoglucomutase/phosphomannomutase family protein [candidate division WOR-3 bacterium]